MKLRITAVLFAVSAVVTGLLVAPAQAAGYELYMSTRNIAISSGGNGKVYVNCHSSSTCRGKISFADDTGTPRYRDYIVGAHKSAYIAVALHTDAPSNPQTSGTAPAGRDYDSVSNVRIKISEKSPRSITHYYTVTTETLLTKQQIRGDVIRGASGSPTDMTDLKVELIRVLRGGNTEVARDAAVASDGSYSLGSVNLGTNNSPSSKFQLRVTGRDSNTNQRFFYYRGSDGNFSGGGRYLRDASTVRADKYDDYNADFHYTSISGNVTKSDGGGAVDNAEVMIASTPPSFSINAATKRELDIPSCGNVFGRDRTNSAGNYRVDFLPYTDSTNNRYMIGARFGSTEIWKGETNAPYGSCYDATDYRSSRANLITLGSGGLTGQNLDLRDSNSDVKINGRYSGFKPTYQGDRWIRIREVIPGLKVLDTPVVAEGVADSALNRVFKDLPPGKYYAEVGRRTGCSDWYPSKFPNNRAYFRGLDRYAENWKSFTTLRSLQGNATSGLEGIARRADPNPARGNPQNTIPGGYAGWMYREYCKAYSEGTINTFEVDGFNDGFTKDTSTAKKGAVVKGRVTRTKGRTNKEMLVRLSSSAGTRVLRTDLTDSKGYFYVAGLDDGNYTISVNSDSWRGISRRFTGKHSITVKAGKLYSVGTLKFYG